MKAGRGLRQWGANPETKGADMAKTRALMDCIARARETVVAGDIPEGVLDLVVDAMEIISPDFGDGMTEDASAHFILMMALDLVGTMRGTEEFKRQNGFAI